METNNTTVTKVCKICNKNRVPIIRKSNDELSNYKPRELIDSLRDIIEELRNRGYVVDVSYSYKIKL